MKHETFGDMEFEIVDGDTIMECVDDTNTNNSYYCIDDDGDAIMSDMDWEWSDYYKKRKQQQQQQKEIRTFGEAVATAWTELEDHYPCPSGWQKPKYLTKSYKAKAH